jgi:hypothetical protein
MLKMYLKPVLTRVEMRPVEAALSACKNVEVLSLAWAGTSGACSPGGPSATSPCLDVAGS